MELAAFYLFLGGILALAFVGMGVIIGRLDGRDNQRQSRIVGDDSSELHVRSRGGSGDNGHDMADVKEEI